MMRLIRLMRAPVLAAGLLLMASAWSVQAQSVQGAPTAVILGTDQPETTFVGKWQRQIYTEALRRMGIAASFSVFPPPRLSALVESGELDGEMARTMEYGAAHPALVRVEESVFPIVFALFTAHPSGQPDSLKALPAGATVEYRRGVLGCENNLKPVIPASHLSDILTTEQGLKKLVSKRTDFYCDLDLGVLNEMSATKASDFAAVRKLFDLGNSTPLYPYLNKKNAALAPSLAATLKQMKAEGLIERYRRDAIRELGPK